MKIVIFDDNQTDMQRLCQIIDEWKKDKRYSDVIMMRYNRISDLDFSLDELIFSDIFFLTS